MRRQIRAQEFEIRMLQRAGVSTASAELLLARMRAKIDDLCREPQTTRISASRPAVRCFHVAMQYVSSRCASEPSQSVAPWM
jgi:hypothetical protein